MASVTRLAPLVAGGQVVDVPSTLAAWSGSLTPVTGVRLTLMLRTR